MKRYYFYAPSKYRNELRSRSVIDFKLAALYAETVYSTKNRTDQRHFCYFDDIDVSVATKEPQLYDFKVETGKDGCMGHWAKSERELLDAKKKDGYRLISENNYLRLRRLAIKLLFRHTQFFNERPEGENRYYSSISNGSPFYDIKLISLNYRYNTQNHDETFFNYLKSNGLLCDVTVPEDIRIFVLKPKKGNRSNENCTFHIKGIGTNPKYASFEKAVKGLVTSRENTKEITPLQYKRIRKICQYIMFESSDLEIEPLKKKQDYSVRMLDNWL